MPEGDTIFRAAATLQRALAGERVVRFDTVLPRLARVDADRPIAGRIVATVTAARPGRRPRTSSRASSRARGSCSA